MKRYYYELLDEDYNSYEAAIPDGRIKSRAIAQAKRAMKDLGGGSEGLYWQSIA